jgi:hypothetical protein
MINFRLKASKQDTTLEMLRGREYDIKMDICATGYGDGSVSELAQNYTIGVLLRAK